ncbi:MAG TPA: winged helix-turn-helix transcriptional regulator [Patescibacteria group bacterium]|nr:winged helix-turn-helix transcriptional regulator [Patescibacteria group bacterium]
MLCAKHVSAIGAAIWVFLWLIDRTTSEELRHGERWGIVLYGRPITARHIAAELGLSERTSGEHLKRLETAGYITMTRKSAGQSIRLRRSFKWLLRSGQKKAASGKTGGSVSGAGQRNTALGSLLKFMEENQGE